MSVQRANLMNAAHCFDPAFGPPVMQPPDQFEPVTRQIARARRRKDHDAILILPSEIGGLGRTKIMMLGQDSERRSKRHDLGGDHGSTFARKRWNCNVFPLSRETNNSQTENASPVQREAFPPRQASERQSKSRGGQQLRHLLTRAANPTMRPTLHIASGRRIASAVFTPPQNGSRPRSPQSYA
jgi:hypothetical protein